MKEIKGDLLKEDFDVIVHGCNCFNIMGAGIAKTIKTIYPLVYSADCETIKGDQSKLGTILPIKVKHCITGKELIVVNGYTQYRYNGNTLMVNYEAVREVFKNVKKNFSGKKIGYPMIGAGLAGGDWDVISKIIDEELVGEDHAVVVYKG